ncbi:hypothetical protein [Candidatus Protochlamydia amoebophila]|uniref:Uncharacterized protein n=1 Tax=Candidatus Protochlamydia amoebophila TaxID=362787 RepID=A0A0C1K329_9BACT|nr:hypothetical protein [Candidatus Protochlamydia amoebophila]KIC73742.1 hypothetical protein DB44_AV00050 [Candidatus Protochlamydia amoebophila]
MRLCSQEALPDGLLLLGIQLYQQTNRRFSFLVQRIAQKNLQQN